MEFLDQTSGRCVAFDVSYSGYYTYILWCCHPAQVKSGTIFDNFLITDDEEYAKEFGDETWGKTKDPEKKMKEEQDEAERKQREEEEKKKKEEEGTDDEEEEEVLLQM